MIWFKEKREAKKQVQQSKQREEEAKLLLNKEREEKKNTKLKLAKMMNELGKSVDEIIKETGLSSVDIEQL